MPTAKVLKTIRKFDLINPGDTIVVAVSGGPDSVAMLCILNTLRSELGFKIHIAHLDHMLRKDSRRDAEFVRKLSQELNLPITARQINVAKLAKGDSIEQAARNVRLEFLFGVAGAQKAKIIALGHTKDDQVETVLMRLIRGAGLYGLCGILPKRKIQDFLVVRPLIEIRRRDVERFLKKNKIPAVTDVTNRDLKFMRNRVRHKLIPLLEKDFNSNIRDVLYHVSRVAQNDYDYLRKESERKFEKAQRRTTKTKVELDLKSLKNMHQSMQSMVVRLGLEKIQGNTRRLTFKHWEELKDLIYNRHDKSIVDLPHRIRAVKSKNSFILSLRKT